MKQSCLIFVIAVFLIFPCTGQNKLDSLRNVWDDKEQSDANRVKALTEYARNYNKTNADSSLYYAEKAYNFANAKGLETYKTTSKVVIWYAYYNKKNYDKANQLNTELLENARKNGDSLNVAKSFHRFGLLNSALNKNAISLDYYQQSLDIYEALNKKKLMGDVLNNMGIRNIYLNNYPEAENCFARCISLYEELGIDASDSAMNLAILKHRKGDYSMALELYQKQLAIYEQNGDEVRAARYHFNIASVYYDLDDREKFFEHSYKALELHEKLENKEGIAKALANLGEASAKYKDYDKALEYLKRSLLISEEIGHEVFIGRALREIGKLQIQLKNYPDAFNNLSRALSIYEKLDYKIGLAAVQRGLGLYYKAIGNTDLALKYLNKCLDNSKNRFFTETRDVSFDLYQLYEDLGNNKLALDSYKLYITTRDSIQAKDNKRAVISQEFKYEYEKKAIRDSIYFESQKEIQNTKLEKTKEERLFLGVILMIVLAASVVIFNRMRLIRSQKITIENQNDELQSLNENLEKKVEDRTQKIVEINKSLKESDERYSYALEAANEGIWDYNVESDSISFSPAIYTMLGFEPYEFPETREEIYNLIHSEDQKNTIKNKHELFLVKEGEEYLNDVFRLNSKDGKVVWIRSKGKIVERNSHNKPIRIVGTHIDITESKFKNKEILEAILRTEDGERSRIAKDIHDGIQQTLTVAHLNIQALKKEVKSLGEKSLEKVTKAMNYVNEAIIESRTVAHSLMPNSIVEFGLIVAVENLLNDLNESSEETKFHFNHNTTEGKLSSEQIEITLYRIIQESTNNVFKYAKAKNVYIQLKEYDDIFMLTIEDDGVGFDTEILRKENKSLGFRSMKNRLDAIDGHLEIDSAVGRGTTILVEIDKK